MNNMIERYIYDVVRRLPVQEQDEVGNELRSHIYDMLPEDATDTDIRTALTGLGAPALLAEQYRQHPRCLISAAVYDDYLHTLKWVLPLVGCLVMVIGLLHGGAEATRTGATGFAAFFAHVVASGISSGLSAALQVLFWVTLGFSIADRVNAKTSAAAKWRLEDLPEEVRADARKIPLSDSIVELVLTAFFSTLAVLLCARQFPIPFLVRGGAVHVHQLFSSSFLAACVPVFAIAGILGMGACAAKIWQRRWKPAVCTAVLLSNLADIVLLCYLCTRPDIFSAEFLAYTQAQQWQWAVAEPIMGTPMVMLIAAIVIIASLAECGTALYRTLRTAQAGK